MGEKKDDEIEESDEMDEFDDDDEEDYDDIAGPKRDHALPIKKRGRPKKILTDAEIEEATRAALGTVPVIEITPVPRKDPEAGSRKEGDDAEDEEESESTNEVPVKEPEAFRPFFVNESLEEETEKTAEVETGGGDDHNPLEDEAKNPLEDDSVGNPLDDDATNPLDDNASNPLDDDPLNAVETTTPLNTEVRSNPLGLDYAAEEPMDNAENPLDGANPLEKSGENPLGDSERLPGVAVTDHSEMSEEDLLTGPAHNLDDSQYKADYADPNLGDIFK